MRSKFLGKNAKKRNMRRNPNCGMLLHGRRNLQHEIMFYNIYIYMHVFILFKIILEWVVFGLFIFCDWFVLEVFVCVFFVCFSIIVTIN